MTFRWRSGPQPTVAADTVTDPQVGQNVLYRQTHATVVGMWDEPLPSGGTVKLARIAFGNGQRRVVFAYQLQEAS